MDTFQSAVRRSCCSNSYRTSDPLHQKWSESERLTCSVMWSICLFCLSISLPMSTAMSFRLPMMLPTASRFSSISSSRASLVILHRSTVTFGHHLEQDVETCWTQTVSSEAHLLMYGPEGVAACNCTVCPLRTPDGCLETTPELLPSPCSLPVPHVRL